MIVWLNGNVALGVWNVCIVDNLGAGVGVIEVNVHRGGTNKEGIARDD